jgi:Domain of unknown function (DUF4157)
MKAVADKPAQAEQRRENMSHSAQRTATQRALSEAPDDASSEVWNNHPATAVERTLQKLANDSLQVKQLAQSQAMANRSSHVQGLARTQEMLNNSPRVLAQRKLSGGSSGKVAQQRKNQTGLPESLKTGIENLSGVSMDGVETHFNSTKPAELKALAYTQGRDIYVGPGQERHLPHEAWHVVQQSQGRVQPTTQAAGVSVNDDESLEQEADVMGAKALQMTQANQAAIGAPAQRASDGQSLGQLPAPHLLLIQRMTAEDLRFLFKSGFGLRHLDSLARAQDEHDRGTIGGDAVPLNPMGQTNDAFALMGMRPLTQEVIDAFVANVEKFIEMSLSRTINIAIGETTPHELVNSVFGKSTFLLVQGMKGADVPKDVEKRDYAGLGKAGKQPITPQQIAHLATFDAMDEEYMHYMHAENWDAPIATAEEGDAIYQDLVFLFSNKIQEAVATLRTGQPPQWYQEVMADLQRPRNYDVPPDFNPDSPETLALLDELSDEDFDFSTLTQKKPIEERATTIQNQSTAIPVAQLMYKNAKLDIEEILDLIRPDNDNNEDDAKAISKLAALDSTTKEQVTQVFNAVFRENFDRENKIEPSTNYQSSLLAALENGFDAFANKLLAVITELSSSKTEEKSNESKVESPSFEKVAREAVESRFPEILERIKGAQDAGVKSGKPLLVMVGEQHDDPYSKLVEAILIKKLKLQKLFIETTPQQVTQYIEPYKDKKSSESETSLYGHRQRFYSYIYEQGANFEGVDVNKESDKEETEKQLGLRPEIDSELTEWKAKFMEQSVVKRNISISKTLMQSPSAGLLLVGATHLPGLATDVELAKAYEIVTISIVLPEAATGRDMIAFGRELETTKGLKSLSGLVVATQEEQTSFAVEDVSASELFALADKLVLEMNVK